VYCDKSGVGRTGNEQWKFFNPANVAGTAAIISGGSVVIQNCGTGAAPRWLRPPTAAL
jgi:hypothetical protein